MMVHDMQERVERAVDRRRAANPDASMTSPEMGLGLMFFSPAIDNTTTTAARGYEHLEWFILGSEVALRGPVFGRHWRVESSPPAVEGVQPSTELAVAEAFDTSDDAKWLRTSLELSMAELAALFGVTRKSAYDWLAGTKTSKAAYIRAVRKVIEGALSPECIPYLRQFWADSREGPSLLDILKSGDARRMPEARAALTTLAGPINDYVSGLRAGSPSDGTPNRDADDLYRTV